MRRTILLLLGGAAALGACGRGHKQAEGNRAAAAAPKGSTVGVTPIADRVAVLGVLNKRNGIVKEVSLRPGQSAR